MPAKIRLEKSGVPDVVSFDIFRPGHVTVGNIVAFVWRRAQQALNPVQGRRAGGTGLFPYHHNEIRQKRRKKITIVTEVLRQGKVRLRIF